MRAGWALQVEMLLHKINLKMRSQSIREPFYPLFRDSFLLRQRLQMAHFLFKNIIFVPELAQCCLDCVLAPFILACYPIAINALSVNITN